MRRLKTDRMNQPIVGPKYRSRRVNNELLRRIEHAVADGFNCLLTANNVDVVVNCVSMQQVF